MPSQGSCVPSPRVVLLGGGGGRSSSSCGGGGGGEIPQTWRITVIFVLYVGLKAAFDAFAGELCVLSPRMLLLGGGGGRSNSNGGGGGGEIVQTSLRFIYEQLGVRTLSPHDLVHLHIMPRLRYVLCTFLILCAFIYVLRLKPSVATALI